MLSTFAMALTRETVDRLLPDLVRRLREALGPVTIYLFGSCAAGTIGPDSDLDVLVVVRETESSFFERVALAYRALRGLGVPIDVQVYTQNEFESRASLPVSFERTVRRKGRVLYAA